MFKQKLFFVLIMAVILGFGPSGIAFAQSEALKSALGEVTEVVKEDPVAALQKVVDFLKLQTMSLEKSVRSFEEGDEEYENLRAEILEFLTGARDYLSRIFVTDENAHDLAVALNEWRENFYNPEVKETSGFILASQTNRILKLAESRYLKISIDVRRLIESKIIIDQTKAKLLLNEANLLLISARDLINQYRDPNTEIRTLASAALGKIKLAYQKFLDINNLIKEARK